MWCYTRLSGDKGVGKWYNYIWKTRRSKEYDWQVKNSALLILCYTRSAGVSGDHRGCANSATSLQIIKGLIIKDY